MTRSRKRKPIIKYPEHLSCSGKKKYTAVGPASDAGKAQMYASGFQVQLYIYQCEYCHGFHLTQIPTDMPA